MKLSDQLLIEIYDARQQTFEEFNDLVTYLDQDKQKVVEALDTLFNKGLIDANNVTEGKYHTISLTESGEQRAIELKKQQDNIVNQVLTAGILIVAIGQFGVTLTSGYASTGISSLTLILIGIIALLAFKNLDREII